MESSTASEATTPSPFTASGPSEPSKKDNYADAMSESNITTLYPLGVQTMLDLAVPFRVKPPRDLADWSAFLASPPLCNLPILHKAARIRAPPVPKGVHVIYLKPKITSQHGDTAGFMWHTVTNRVVVYIQAAPGTVWAASAQQKVDQYQTQPSAWPSSVRHAHLWTALQRLYHNTTLIQGVADFPARAERVENEEQTKKNIQQERQAWIKLEKEIARGELYERVKFNNYLVQVAEDTKRSFVEKCVKEGHAKHLARQQKSKQRRASQWKEHCEQVH